ncbi:MAG: hypothetical protein E7233_09790 [Lachnospiraceae bacterium]|nr:hypothetical protein [Lachnospiraceae bacterium]
MARTNQKLDDIYGVKSERSFFKGMPEGTTSDWVRNKRYHDHFRGYTEVRTTDEHGHVVIERYYTSPWTVSGLSERNYWIVRILFALLTLGSGALYIYAMSQDIPANRHWAVAIPGLPFIIFLILLIVRVGIFFAAPRKMTLWDFESSSKKLRQMALIAAIVEALTGIVMGIYALVTKVQVGQTLLCSFMVIVGAICIAAIYFIEKRLPYKEVANHTEVPEGEQYKIR